MKQNKQCLICHEHIIGLEPREMILCVCKFIACDDCFRQLTKCIYCHKQLLKDENDLTENQPNPPLNSVLQRSYDNGDYIDIIDHIYQSCDMDDIIVEFIQIYFSDIEPINPYYTIGYICVLLSICLYGF